MDNTPQSTPQKSNAKNWLIAMFIVLVILVGIFFYVARQHKKSMERITVYIDKVADTYGINKDKAKKLLVDTAGEIISDRNTRKQAEKYAYDMSIPYEQAVVDMSVGQLRAMGYLK